jgi:hypothetical protein
MADIKKGSDLITTLGDTEKRLKKVERQLAVPRKGASSIVTESSLIVTTGTPVAIGLDSVTVVCTEVCLVHVYVQLQMFIASGTATVFLRDVTAGTNTQIIASSIDGSTYATVAGSNTGVDITTASGGIISFVQPNLEVGPREYRLFCLAPSPGIIFADRKLFAWVQPF